MKAKKHDEIRILAKSKLNTVADHASSALMDGRISDEEFRLIIDELKKYGQLKAEIRSGARKAHAAVELDEETKSSLIKQGKEEARASIIKSSPFQILRLPELCVFPLTPTVSRACYVATALLGINQFWAHNAYFVKCKNTKPAQLLLRAPLGGGAP